MSERRFPEIFGLFKPRIYVSLASYAGNRIREGTRRRKCWGERRHQLLLYAASMRHRNGWAGDLPTPLLVPFYELMHFSASLLGRPSALSFW